MRPIILPLLALCLLPDSAAARPVQFPNEDIGLTPTTPIPDEDLVIVRERAYGAAGVDLTGYGIGAGPVDYVQSIYFRLYTDGNPTEAAAVAGRVVFPPEVTILGIIVNGGSLGGSTDDGVFTATDDLFGIGTDPDFYSAPFRGFETTGQEFVCQATDQTMVFGLSTTNGVDDFRVIIDYGSSFGSDLSFSVYSYGLPEIAGAAVSPGYQIGDVVTTTVPGSGAFSDAGSLINIPLTANNAPFVGCDITTTPDRNIYVLRNTGNDTEVDSFDVDLLLPGPSLYSVDQAIMDSPVALTAGPDNLLYAMDKASGYAVIDTNGGLTNEVAIQDLAGDFKAMTYLPGGRELYMARNTSGDSYVDTFDVDTLLFIAEYPIPASTVGSPVGIAPGSDGLLYVTGTNTGFASVDPVSGTVVNIGNSPPGGTYTGIASRPGSSKLYFSRNTGSNTRVDTYDVATGLFAYELASFPIPSSPVGLSIGPDGLLYIAGKGLLGAAGITAVDPDTGLVMFTNECMDFSGSLVGIAFTAPGPQGFYCGAKVNSQGCTPQIGFSGSASMSSPSPFAITCSNVLNNKFGLLFYGLGSNSAPFQGGTLCVQAPIKRTAVQNSGGNQGPSDCSGTFTFDFNALLQSGTDTTLMPCISVFAQYWYRDPQDPAGFGSGLSNALEFEIGL